MPKVAFLSGAPRVSTRAGAEAGGARQHVLGTIAGFEENGWDVAPYIVGDKVPAAWLAGGRERKLRSSVVHRLAADVIRVALAIFHARGASKEIPVADWVYERCGAFQFLGYPFQRRRIPWILETNYLMYDELQSDRKSVALGSIVRRIEQFVYRKCDVLVTVSEELKVAVVEKLAIPAGKIVVVPNGADVNLFDPGKAEARRLFDDQTFVIGFQGSMYQWAGLDKLLQAVAVMRSRGLPVACTLVGDGHERVALEALAADLGIASCARFVGFVPRDEVPAYILGFDLCYSGQIRLQNNNMYLSPLKLYDYMSMGKVVLASRFSDAINLTRDGSIGYLFDSGDVNDIVVQASAAYENRENLGILGVAARAEILANHTWASRVREFIPVAKAIIAAGRPASSLPQRLDGGRAVEEG